MTEMHFYAGKRAISYFPQVVHYHVLSINDNLPWRCCTILTPFARPDGTYVGIGRGAGIAAIRSGLFCKRDQGL